MKEQKKFTLKIENTEEGGHYANIFTIVNTENEFLIDFGIVLPGTKIIKVVSRVILSPKVAKQLMITLQNGIRNYENLFGEIKIQPPKTPFNKGPHPIN